MYVIGFSKDNLIGVDSKMVYCDGKLMVKATGFVFGYDKDDIIPLSMTRNGRSIVFNAEAEATLREIKDEYENLRISGKYNDNLIKLNKEDLKIYELNISLSEVKGD